MSLSAKLSGSTLVLASSTPVLPSETNRLESLRRVATAGHRISVRWFSATNRYLGLKFKIKGKIHFGWARLSVVGRQRITATLTGYTYETIPGKAIKAGQTKGTADNPSNGDLGPGASLTNPIPDTPQPASLGMLALGAQSVPLWWLKESSRATEIEPWR
jgi:hypothetical protein